MWNLRNMRSWCNCPFDDCIACCHRDLNNISRSYDEFLKMQLLGQFVFLAFMGFSRPHKMLPSAHTAVTCHHPQHPPSSHSPLRLPTPSLALAPIARQCLNCWGLDPPHPLGAPLGPASHPGLPVMESQSTASLSEVAWPLPHGHQSRCSAPLPAAAAGLGRPFFPPSRMSHPADIASTSQAPLGLQSGQRSWGS